MLFFFDDSGDFSLPPVGKHKCACVCGLIIPETIELEVQHAFQVFCKTLKTVEKTATGEPKGSLLEINSRLRFFDLLNSYPDIKVIPSTMDLGETTKHTSLKTAEKMRTVFYQHSDKYIHVPMQEQIRLLGRQIGNLSTNQIWRLMTLAACIKRAVEHLVIFFCMPEYWTCYEQMLFCVDASNVSRDAREERVARFLLFSWICKWSEYEPLIYIKGMHNKNHPFVRRYGTEKGTDIGKLVRDNLVFTPSTQQWGLQMADIVANTLYKVLHDLDNTNGMLPFWSRMMKNSHCGQAVGPGLIVTGDRDNLGEIELSPKKYKILSDLQRKD